MREKGFALLLVLVIAVVFILTSAGVFVFREFQKNNRPQESSFKQEKPAAKQEDIYNNAGFYLNRDLQFSFKYPTNWILGGKVIDRKGNLNNLTLVIDPSVSESSKSELLSKLESLSVSVTREGGENYADFFISSKSNQEKKQLGDLNGDFYSNTTGERYTATFIAASNDVKYGFILSTPIVKKEENLAKFEELISTFKGNDPRASNLPEYFRDNLALDKRISQPSYIPINFSITYEKQQQSNQEWNYSIGVWERGSGPNNLNIYVQGVDTKNDLGPRQFTVNLENLLEEKSIHQPVVEKGVAKVEPIEVKGFKGYFINIGKSLDNSYGSLIFATDVVAVSIDYISEPNSVFSKEELLKIAESMIHI